MRKNNILPRKLKAITEKPYICGKALGRLLMESYIGGIDGNYQQVDFALYADTERRLYGSGMEREIRDYLGYRNLYYAFFPLYEKTKLLSNTLSVSINELTSSLFSKFDEVNDNDMILHTPYVLSKYAYNTYAISALDNVSKDKTDDFILEALNYYLGEGRKKAPLCIHKELKALEEQHFTEQDTPPSIPLYVAFLKESGEQILGGKDEKYITALKEKAKEHNIESLEEYSLFCDTQTKTLYFKGQEAIKDYIKEHTGESLKLTKDKDLEETLYRLIGTCSTKILHFYPQLVELENSLGLLPAIELKKIKGKTSLISSKRDYLSYFTSDIDTIKKFYPSLYSAFVEMIKRGDPLEIGSYPLFKFCTPSLDYSVLTRIKHSGAFYPVDDMNIEEPTNITDTSLSHYEESLTRPSRQPLEERHNTIYRAISSINCFNILTDLIADTFKVKSLKDFAKVEMKDLETLIPQYNSAIAVIYYSYTEKSDPAKRKEYQEEFKKEYGTLRPFSDFLPSQESIAQVYNLLKELYSRGGKDPRYCAFNDMLFQPLYDSIVI